MPKRAFSVIQDFFRLEAAGGIVLFAAAVLAMIANNTAVEPWYDAFLDVPVGVRIGALALEKPLLLWINDGLMAIFFLLVGLEIKREMLEGELSSVAQFALPAAAAVCGMAVPAAIFVAFNAGDSAALRGWAIPSATDIAFALGVLALLGSRVPVALKVFLTAVAVLDDLGAIVIIAAFYTSDLSYLSLVVAAIALAVLIGLNLAGVVRIAPYVLVGVVLWVFVLKSGVHATLAGVAIGLAIPLRARDADGQSPLRRLEHVLYPWVSFAVLPLFAFANAGMPLGGGVGLDRLMTPVPMGIAAGLFLGKQIGIFGAVFLMVRLRMAPMPVGATWPAVYGIALLCGIGFTMSLFIGTLAYDLAARAVDVRVGVIAGSIASAIAGYAVLRFAKR